MWFIYFVLIRNYIKSFQGEMKKIIFLFAVLVVMNGCAQSTSFVGPTYTMVKSGSMIQAGNSFAASYGFTKLTGATPGDVAISLTKNDKFETFASETIRLPNYYCSSNYYRKN